MEDKEVGELWRGVLEAKRLSREWAHPVLHCVNQKEVLIRKLVEERAGKYQVPEMYTQISKKRLIGYALRDFDIDPATWPLEKVFK